MLCASLFIYPLPIEPAAEGDNRKVEVMRESVVGNSGRAGNTSTEGN